MEHRNDLWLESVYSDGTAAFVSSPCPKLFETVTIRLRFYRDAPVKHVFLRTIPNGVEKLIPMVREKEEKGLVYYEAPLQMTENRMQYVVVEQLQDECYYDAEDGGDERHLHASSNDGGVDVAHGLYLLKRHDHAYHGAEETERGCHSYEQRYP